MKNKIDHSASLSALLREAEVAHVENDSVADLSVSRQTETGMEAAHAAHHRNRDDNPR